VAGFDFAFAIWILNATRHGDRAVVSEDIAIQRIQRGIVDVGDEHAFAQIVEHDDASGATESAEGTLVQFGPDASTGAEGKQPNRFATTTERHDEQPCAPMLASVGIAHHRPSAVIDLRFLTGRSRDHHAGFGSLRAA
jgi:hypothetical protein